MLNAAMRSLLATIEANIREVEVLKLAESEAKKRVKRLKSEKFVLQATAELDALTARFTELDSRVAEDTAQLFSSALGIVEDGVAALYGPDGTHRGSVLVHMMRARQLEDGSAVLTVSGDSVASETNAGAFSFADPWQMLIAAESRGERLESLT